MKRNTKNKWYYRKPGGPHPLANFAKAVELNHRDIAEPKRGEFVVTNPYELTNYDDVFSNFANSRDDIQIDTWENNSNTTTNNNNAASSTSTNNASAQDVEYDLYAELDKKFMELYGSNKKNNN